MAQDAVDMKGRTCFITGANTGIGKETAIGLATLGANLVLAGRSRERTQETLDRVAEIGPKPAVFIPLDLGSFESVRAAAATFSELGLPIDVLINNAGLAGAKGTTTDGFELTFGVNHLGHFLLTMLLAEHVAKGDSPRVVNVASQAHYGAKNGIDFEAVQKKTASSTGFPEYQVSKLANVLFSAELNRRVPEFSTYALHPGVIASDVWRKVPRPFRSLIKLFMKSSEDGAKTSLHCASSVEAGNESGLYYDSCKTKTPSPHGQDEELAKELWAKSVEWTGADL